MKKILPIIILFTIVLVPSPILSQPYPPVVLDIPNQTIPNMGTFSQFDLDEYLIFNTQYDPFAYYFTKTIELDTVTLGDILEIDDIH